MIPPLCEDALPPFFSHHPPLIPLSPPLSLRVTAHWKTNMLALHLPHPAVPSINHASPPPPYPFILSSLSAWIVTKSYLQRILYTHSSTSAIETSSKGARKKSQTKHEISSDGSVAMRPLMWLEVEESWEEGMPGISGVDTMLSPRITDSGNPRVGKATHDSCAHVCFHTQGSGKHHKRRPEVMLESIGLSFTAKTQCWFHIHTWFFFNFTSSHRFQANAKKPKNVDLGENFPRYTCFTRHTVCTCRHHISIFWQL